MESLTRRCLSLRAAALVNVLVAGVALWAAPALADDIKIPGLEQPVSVHYDEFGIPHIFARSWTDACRALGYVHATDRLWEMDMFRRKASGTTAELLGPGELESDVLVRQLGIRRSCEQILASDQAPPAMRAELTAYAAGVNARIDELGKNGLPSMFKVLAYQPEPWTEVDSIAFGKYMAWDQSGTEADLWFGTVVEKLGVEATEALWPLDRPYEIPTVKAQFDRNTLTLGRRAAFKPQERHAQLKPIPGTQAACVSLIDRFARAGWFARGESIGSNNWAVDGKKTRSGKPILCSDPHLGFFLPSLWYTCHLCVDGHSVAGVTFPGTPSVIIGHNDYLGWGITNMQADAVDFFIETINPDNPQQYRHRGQWKQIERRTEQVPVRGQKPHELNIDSTIHGPILQRDGKTISLQWTGLGATTEMIGFWEINHATNIREFLHAADKIVVPAINLCYADVDGHIALHPCGSLPLRLPGQGRIPMDGSSGDNDWTDMIPRAELPLAVDPKEHFVASANGRPAANGYPHYLGWMWDPSYRIRRINVMLAQADDLTVESMQAVQNDVYDFAAEQFLPVMLAALKQTTVEDDYARRLAGILEKWDYRATPDALAPRVWLAWMSRYRDAVWNDEWETRALVQPSGSWGFSGLNRREPMLEVFEYLTRENPQSIWFDDRRTPARETRDDVLVATFLDVAAQLKQQHGDDPAALAWKNFNVLKIGSMTGLAQLGRDGGPIPGSSFTVNPGGGGGSVGGGASFRMIVDFGDVAGSVGVYPGGQSENPADAHYADQMPLWAHGRYARLNVVSDPAKLPATSRARSVTFKP